MTRLQLSRRHLPWVVLGLLSVGVGVTLAWQSGDLSVLLGSREIPSFRLEDRDGKAFSSTQLRGRPAIIHFWASWCAPCLTELPAWLKKAERSADSPLSFVAISLDTQWRDAEAVLSKSKVPAGLILLLDPEQSSSEAFGSYQFPETYLLDADGRIVRKWVGAQNWEEMDFARLLAAGAQ